MPPTISKTICIYTTCIHSLVHFQHMPLFSSPKAPIRTTEQKRSLSKKIKTVYMANMYTIYWCSELNILSTTILALAYVDSAILYKIRSCVKVIPTNETSCSLLPLFDHCSWLSYPVPLLKTMTLFFANITINL